MKRAILIIYLLMTLPFLNMAEEGMYPLSEIHKLNLDLKGFKIDAPAIFNPGKISLIDGIVNLSGCTGSFVSSEGLILTNHHCAFRAIQSVSTKEKDYLTQGFLANNRQEEKPATGYRVRITESYRDVSQEVLRAINKKMNFTQRTKAIEKKIKEIILRTEKQNPGKRADVSEMFPGKTYVLFIYTYLKDIRLVYAPPRAVGNYGGEIDNWMWPRHTGDFSFMRAYVAPDGSAASYSANNIPYKPKKYLQIAPQGVNEGDLVFILGYPGRTYRHRTASYLHLQQKIIMPYQVKLYEWQISVLEKLGEDDREIALKVAPRIKGLSNRMKNYKGKLKGLNRLKIVGQKRKNEKGLQSFIESDPQLEKTYGNLLNKINSVYEEQKRTANHDLTLRYLVSSSNLLSWANTLYEASIELTKKDTDRKSRFMKRNVNRTLERIKIGLKNYCEPADKIFLKEMLLRAIELKDCQRIPAIDALIKSGNPVKAIDQFIKNAYQKTRLHEEKYVLDGFKLSQKELEDLNDPFISLAKDLYPLLKEMDENDKRQKGILDELYAQLIDIKQRDQGKSFIPDANGTLRLTFGHIRSYSPADAVLYKPISTLKGVVEKHCGQIPFNAPPKLLDLYAKGDFGRFKHPQLEDVPVNILYSADTTGGNSGSPVLNASGELIGLNFDRAFEATINDFAWNINYSRSIGVDIRYILWFMEKFSNVTHLLTEMKIK